MKKKVITLLLVLIGTSTISIAQWSIGQQLGSTVLSDIHFYNSSNGWVVAENGAIYATTNGGTSWTYQTSGYSSALRGIHFATSSTGWAVGLNGVIIKTTNGGATWTPQTSGITTPLNAVYFISESTGWATGNAGVVLKTTDGGTTWTNMNTGIVKNFYGIVFTSATKGWVVGANGAIYLTSNGGSIWTSQNAGVTITLNAISVTDNILWVAGDNGTILKSTDEGAYWGQKFPGTTAVLSDITFVSAFKGWAVGSGGVIKTTSDGGMTWENQTSGSSQTLKAIYMTSANTGFIVGTTGALLKFTCAAPIVQNVTHGTSCGPGVIHLSANVSAGTIYWYDAPTGGNILIVGNTYNTPLLNSSKKYWLEGINNGCLSVTRSEIKASILPVDSVKLNANTLTAYPPNATYKWINCATNQVIPGATTQTYTPSVSGTYAVILTQNNCTDTSSCLAVTISASSANLESIKSDAKISLSPNPTTGNFIITQENSNSQFSVTLYNAVGQKLTEYLNLEGENTSLSLDGKAGIYFVDICTSSGEMTRMRLIKE